MCGRDQLERGCEIWLPGLGTLIDSIDQIQAGRRGLIGTLTAVIDRTQHAASAEGQCSEESNAERLSACGILTWSDS